MNYNLALIYAVQGRGALAEAAYADALSHSGPPDRQGALTDIHHALAKQPGAVALRQALAQVERGSTSAAPRLPVLPLPAPPSTPRPPAAFAARLGPEVTMGGYGIQPPRGYSLTQRPVVTLTSTGTTYLWTGSARLDGTVPTLQVVIAQDDGTLAAHSTSQQNTQMEMDAMRENHTHLTESPVTACVLGGLPFARGGWDGIGQRTGKEYRGSEYWMVSPSSIIHITTHDAVPYDSESLPLLNASISTFRKL